MKQKNKKQKQKYWPTPTVATTAKHFTPQNTHKCTHTHSGTDTSKATLAQARQNVVLNWKGVATNIDSNQLPFIHFITAWIGISFWMCSACASACVCVCLWHSARVWIQIFAFLLTVLFFFLLLKFLSLFFFLLFWLFVYNSNLIVVISTRFSGSTV